MKSILFRAVCALLLLAPLGAHAQSVFADGREWRQVDATSGRGNSFSDLYMACGANAGVCGGVLAGWTWATNSEVQSLWESLTGVTGLGTSVQTGVNTAWATTIFSNFTRTEVTLTGVQILSGWTRAASSGVADADLARISRRESASGSTFDRADLLDTNSFSDARVGAWLYATTVPVTAPIPEPETYALMLAGLGLLAFARRRAERHSASYRLKGA